MRGRNLHCPPLRRRAPVVLLGRPPAERRERVTERHRRRDRARHVPQLDPVAAAGRPGGEGAERSGARVAERLVPRPDPLPDAAMERREQSREHGRDEPGRDRPRGDVHDHAGAAACGAVTTFGDDDREEDARDDEQGLPAYRHRPEPPQGMRRTRNERKGHRWTIPVPLSTPPGLREYRRHLTPPPSVAAWVRTSMITGCLRRYSPQTTRDHARTTTHARNDRYNRYDRYDRTRRPAT